MTLDRMISKRSKPIAVSAEIIGTQIGDLPSKSDSLRTIENLLDVLIAKFSDIHMHFKRSSVSEKRKLIGSMYSKNLCLQFMTDQRSYFNKSSLSVRSFCQAVLQVRE